MSEEPRQNKKRRGLKVLLIIVSVLMAIGIGLAYLLWWELTRQERISMTADYMVIAPELNITEKGRDGLFKTIETAPYGTILNIQRKGERQNSKNYFKVLSSSVEVDKYKKNDFYVETLDEYELQDMHHNDRFNRIFPLKETQQLPTHIKKALVEDSYYGNEYRFTQDVHRIKSSIVWADFNKDEETDIAVLLEQNNHMHKLYVLCYNKDLKQSYITHTDYNGGFAVIRFFKENALIFMGGEKLEKAPNCGIIYESTQKENGFKYAVIYEPKTMKFAQYIQKPLSEIQAEEFEHYHDDYRGEYSNNPVEVEAVEGKVIEIAD